MKANLKTTVVGIALAAFTISGVAWAVQTTKDRTKYDCKVIVGYKHNPYASKPGHDIPIWECPHKDMMAAGKCETSWLFGMRCKE